MAAQPGVISLQGADCFAPLPCPDMQSAIPAIADACCCTIAADGLAANATPCPARPRTTPSKRRWRIRRFSTGWNMSFEGSEVNSGGFSARLQPAPRFPQPLCDQKVKIYVSVKPNKPRADLAGA